MTELTLRRLIALSGTLAFVRDRSEFYRPLIRLGRIAPADSPGILQALPVLGPEQWHEHRRQIRTGPVDGAITGFTNGTTGTPKIFYCSPSEVEAFAANAKLDGRRRLNLIGTNHGAAASAGASAETSYLPLVSRRHFDLAARIIARDDTECAGPPVRVLAGTLRQIKDLTLYMADRYGTLSGFGIELIEAGRHMLSARWEERLRSWWNAEVVAVYGFSELQMCNARTCRECGYHHLPETCIGEVIDLRDPTHHVAAGERGALVVTAFYPYVALEPRLRYRPGDVVGLASQPCPVWGELGFRPLGREHQCLASNSGTELITAADCFAALADLPQVNVRHEDHVLSGPAPGWLHESGSPRFALREADAGPELHVELRFDPHV